MFPRLITEDAEKGFGVKQYDEDMQVEIRSWCPASSAKKKSCIALQSVHRGKFM
jgi:hypothetical protein